MMAEKKTAMVAEFKKLAGRDPSIFELKFFMIYLDQGMTSEQAKEASWTIF